MSCLIEVSTQHVHAHLALATLKTMHLKFGCTLDSTTTKEVDEVLLRARATLAEHVILDALKKHDTEWEQGVDDINDVVKGFGAGKLKPSEHLHRALWRFAQQMIKGVQFE